MAYKTGAPIDGVQQLKNDLRQQTFHTLYVFCGEESYLRDHYVKLLTKKLLGDAADAFNYRRFSTEDLTPEVLAEAVEAMPMMAEHTMVRIDDVNLFEAKEEDREKYMQILSDIPDYCCVVLYYDAIPYKTDGKLRKLCDVMKRCATVVEFRKQDERELSAWICRHFKAEGKEISDELCRYLIFLTDGLMAALGTDIRKIASFSSSDHILKEDIDAVVIPALNAQTFDISNAIADGNYAKALSKMQTLFSMQEDCFLILGAISAQLRRLLYAKTLAAGGKGQDALVELTGMKPYAAGLTVTAARRVSERFCVRAMELCLETDLKMKTSTDDPQRLLELLLVQLAAEAKHG